MNGVQDGNIELWKDVTPDLAVSFSSATSVSLPEVAEVALVSYDSNQTEVSLPTCDLDSSLIEGDISLPVALMMEEDNMGNCADMDNFYELVSEPRHSSTPIKKVQPSSRRLVPSQSFQSVKSNKSEIIAAKSVEISSSHEKSAIQRKAIRVNCSDTKPLSSEIDELEDITLKQKWKLTTVLAMNGCAENCAKAVHMLNEYDILSAHYLLVSKSTRDQNIWLMQYFDSHCPCNDNGVKDVKRISFNIQGRTVCFNLWLQILSLSVPRYYRLRNEYLQNGGINYLSMHHRPQHQKKTMEAIAWMNEYFQRIGDKRPDNDGIYLPTCLTEKKIYEIMIDELCCEESQCISYSKFCLLFHNDFKNVSIPKVN